MDRCKDKIKEKAWRCETEKETDAKKLKKQPEIAQTMLKQKTMVCL